MRPFARLALAVLVCAVALSGPPARTSIAAEAAAPYRNEEVRFVAGDTTLAATIYRPAGRAAAGLVVAPGSGAFGRELPFYASLADTLARAGFAVLIYDKRGVGASGGRYHEVADYARASDDLAAAVACLASSVRDVSGRVGVLGVSQGGWTGSTVAAREPLPAFYIGVSTPGVSTTEQYLHERTRHLVEGGYSAADIAEITALRRLLWSYYETGREQAALDRAYQAARSRPWFVRLGWGDSTPTISDLNESQQRSFRGVGRLDPGPALRALRVPVLLVFGDRDAHVDVPRSLAAHRAAFAASGHADTTLIVLPGLGHGLQPVPEHGECVTCPSHGEMPRTDPAAYSAIVAWLRGRFPRPR